MGQRFMLSLTCGTTAMALGFAVRIVLAHNPYSMGIYIIEDLVSFLTFHSSRSKLLTRSIFFQLILLSPCAFFACD